jgi:hypothetical protein
MNTVAVNDQIEYSEIAKAENRRLVVLITLQSTLDLLDLPLFEHKIPEGSRCYTQHVKLNCLKSLQTMQDWRFTGYL